MGDIYNEALESFIKIRLSSISFFKVTFPFHSSFLDAFFMTLHMKLHSASLTSSRQQNLLFHYVSLNLGREHLTVNYTGTQSLKKNCQSELKLGTVKILIGLLKLAVSQMFN